MGACALIVEDNPVNVEYLSALLRAQGVEATGVADGFQGLRVARTQHLDLVLCDLQMPRMTGFDFLEALRADPSLRDLPVLAVTACAMEGDRVRIRHAGFDGYVPKPIDPLVLIEEVEGILRRRHIQRLMQADAPPPHDGTPATSTLLVMDPLPSGLESKCAALAAAGYSVLPASDIEKTLELVGVVRPAMILIEVGTHLGSSVETLRRIRADALLRDVPVVLMANGHQGERFEALVRAMGVTAFIPWGETQERDVVAVVKEHLP